MNLKIWVVILLCAGCTQKELSDDLGSEYSVQDKNAAAAKALGTNSPESIYKGEFSAVEFSQRLFSSPAVLTGARAIDILERVDFTDYATVKILTRDYTYYEDGTKSLNQYVDDDGFLKDKPSSLLSYGTKKEFFPMILKPQDDDEEWSFSPCSSWTAPQAPPPGYRHVFYNLKSVTATVAPPQLVQEATDCAGIPGCKITTTTLTYDEVIQAPNGAKDRYNCSLVISPNVPYLSNTLKRCLKFTAKVSDRNVPVESCLNVINFRFGKK